MDTSRHTMRPCSRFNHRVKFSAPAANQRPLKAHAVVQAIPLLQLNAIADQTASAPQASVLLANVVALVPQKPANALQDNAQQVAQKLIPKFQPDAHAVPTASAPQASVLLANVVALVPL